MTLFAHKKSSSMYQTSPNEYYKHVYVQQNYWEAIDFIARTNNVSRKQVVHDLLQRGLSKYIGEQIRKNNLMMEEERKKGQREYPTYFMARFRYLAKQKGFYICNFV